MKDSNFSFQWADLAFGSKKPINDLKATFIAAPREISANRFKQLIRSYLPKGDLVLGLSHEQYVDGLEYQPQFRMLTLDSIKEVLIKVNAQSANKIYTLTYFQRDLPYLLEKLRFRSAVFINGSWYHALHLRPEFYALINNKVPYELVSPFADEAEALAYAEKFAASQPEPVRSLAKAYTAAEMHDLAAAAAKHSFAYSEHQIGVSLGKRIGKSADKYKLLLTAHNRIVPYETYAMHHGASREKNFSPMNDLNHYDVNHAEVEAVVAAGKQGIDLAGTALFINVLPCPTCARMLTSTNISEVIYTEEHSAGYAIRMLESAGKKVRRAL